MLIPIEIPPGVYRNGTELQQSGRWRDANLIRWIDGAVRPVGGWRTREASAFNAAARGLVSWRGFSGGVYLAGGTYNKLFAMTGNNTVYDITPTGLTSGFLDAEINNGYGGYFYGSSFYGTERVAATGYGEATTWSLDNWGENLIACSNADGGIYEWDLDLSGIADPVANAPTGNLGIMVTEERFLFALGANGNPRSIAWCDREDNTTWTPAATNEAGDYQLQTSGSIMCGQRVQGRSLIITDIDAHAATYVGPPYVYGFERVGNHCGIVGRKASTVIDNVAFWMGADGFYLFDGARVERIKCDVSDYVFGNLNVSQKSKVFACPLSEFGEVWWFYADGDSIENNRYVSYNYRDGYWMTGEISRTSAVDAGVFTHPIATSADGDVIEHEAGLNMDDASVYAESGPIMLGAGDNVMSVNHLYPDEVTQGDVTVSFKTRFYPNGTEREYGPYSMSAPTSVRFTGRQVRMRVTGNRLADWRVGIMRIDAKQRGRR